MSGQRGMTGKPLYLKCSQCKKVRDLNDNAMTGKLVRTGRERHYKPRGSTGRTLKTKYECRCRLCGAIGWYAHADAAKLPIDMPPAKPSDFEPGFIEALESLKLLERKALCHNGGIRLSSCHVLILVDCALVLLDRFDSPKAKAHLLENFRFERMPR